MANQSVLESKDRRTVRYYQGRKYHMTINTQTVVVFDQSAAYVNQQMWRHVHIYSGGYGGGYTNAHFKRVLVNRHYWAEPF